MKLKNKKTGEIKEFVLFDGKEMQGGATLARLNEEWEDYKEPETLYYVTAWGDIREYAEREEDRFAENQKREIGNYFKTKEEAERAVEKLKAWKRLKDKGFRFSGYELVEGEIHFYIDLRPLTLGDLYPNLGLLFGGEDE